MLNNLKYFVNPQCTIMGRFRLSQNFWRAHSNFYWVYKKSLWWS